MKTAAGVSTLLALGLAVLAPLGCAAADTQTDAGASFAGSGNIGPGGNKDGGSKSDVFAPFTDSGGGSATSCDGGVNLNGCPCPHGSPARNCYPGPASQAGIGSCVWGTQQCESSKEGEFGAGVWGACKGAGAPLTCAGQGVTCGTVSDGCGGQLTCGAPCAACEPGATTFSTPGTFDFSVPNFVTLTVELWGGGGGGTAYSQVDAPTRGGDSSFKGAVIAGGGAAALDGSAAPGGTASGGTTNLPGGQGAPACAQYLNLCSGYTTRIGGDAPMGGAGGKNVTSLDACASLMFGGAAGDGENGQAPGGGGSGDFTCQFDWLHQQGWGMGGAGAGAGSYAKITYSKGDLTPGSTVPVVVGEAGRGSKGAMSSQAPGGGGKNPGYYSGGDGGRGEVRITWTCK